MKTLSVTGFNFYGNIDYETTFYKKAFIAEFTTECAAAEAVIKQREVFDKYGEWPSNEASDEEIEIYQRVESAEAIAWNKAFKIWQKNPGDNGENFEYTVND